MVRSGVLWGIGFTDQAGVSSLLVFKDRDDDDDDDGDGDGFRV